MNTKATESKFKAPRKVAWPDRGGTGGVHGSEWMPYSTYGAHRQALHRMGSTS